MQQCFIWLPLLPRQNKFPNFFPANFWHRNIQCVGNKLKFFTQNVLVRKCQKDIEFLIWSVATFVVETEIR